MQKTIHLLLDNDYDDNDYDDNGDDDDVRMMMIDDGGDNALNNSK